MGNGRWAIGKNLIIFLPTGIIIPVSSIGMKAIEVDVMPPTLDRL
jgi:hypothetical protein